MSTATQAGQVMSERRPHFRRQNAPAMRLTEDDIAIIRHVAKHRFLRATDIVRLLDRPYKKVTARLAMLYHNHYLDRPRAQLEYYTPKAREPYVYAVGNKGAAVLAEIDGYEAAKVDWTDKNRDATRPFIKHALLISDVLLAFEIATRSHPTTKLMQKDEILSRSPEKTQRAFNPLKWSATVTPAATGRPQSIAIIPDQMFGLDFTHKRKRAHFFLEADTARMPVQRSNLTQSSVQKKLLAYYQGHRADQHTAQFNIKEFRVLTLTTTPERVANMVKAVQEITGGRGSNLFLFADRASFNATDNVLTYPFVSGKAETVILAE